MSHYDWLEENFEEFVRCVGVDFNKLWGSPLGLISAHGDKCYGYESKWRNAGIPFERGVAIYLLTYMKPFSDEVRETENGWVDVSKWVVDNYKRFEGYFSKE